MKQILRSGIKCCFIFILFSFSFFFYLFFDKRLYDLSYIFAKFFCSSFDVSRVIVWLLFLKRNNLKFLGKKGSIHVTEKNLSGIGTETLVSYRQYPAPKELLLKQLNWGEMSIYWATETIKEHLTLLILKPDNWPNDYAWSWGNHGNSPGSVTLSALPVQSCIG